MFIKTVAVRSKQLLNAIWECAALAAQAWKDEDNPIGLKTGTTAKVTEMVGFEIAARI